MPIKETAEKLERYQERLRTGKAEKIQPEHVAKILEKLTSKETEITAELAAATKQGKRERLEHKLATVQELIEKARWLASQV